MKRFIFLVHDLSTCYQFREISPHTTYMFQEKSLSLSSANSASSGKYWDFESMYIPGSPSVLCGTYFWIYVPRTRCFNWICWSWISLLAVSHFTLGSSSYPLWFTLVIWEFWWTAASTYLIVVLILHWASTQCSHAGSCPHRISWVDMENKINFSL